ncbi:ribonuclease P protein subunit p20-like [Varroa jacobsoni]|uniref:Ribonuclease P protein subunit p20 n=1 Tax=Varroa destructor TaxID=109461 RepID=A0A7M7KMR5_VARDE|nr:ribonuclease P protein subunit p20-like [Varroa destructor]XP_022663252.1 ribonuclease P protein subunit p20-like [Varroa destructor]XP_022709179.1 ribonuclease P protein subunit p20-like [Varroa jacobsoni]XP_022709180.1 ribonuclease P protein subunit p20-like [Varroa jacobsoni]
MSSDASKKRVQFDKSEYELRKRPPPQMPRSPNHVYVNTRTEFKHQFERAKDVLLGGGKEVHIHGIGAAVNRAINIALQVQSHFGEVMGTDVRTGTIEVTDDLEPLANDVEPQSQKRKVSTIHIRVFRKSESATT